MIKTQYFKNAKCGDDSMGIKRLRDGQVKYWDNIQRWSKSLYQPGDLTSHPFKKITRAQVRAAGIKD